MSLTYKQRLAKWIGHDPAITEAASTVGASAHLSFAAKIADRLRARQTT